MSMKKTIALIASLFLSMPIFGVSKGEILGSWNVGNETITFTSDTIFWDVYTDNNLGVLEEGDVYTYEIVGDVIFFEDIFTKYQMKVEVEGKDLKLFFPHEKDPITYHKIDTNQEKGILWKKSEK